MATKDSKFGEFAELAAKDKKEDSRAHADGLVLMYHPDHADALPVHPTCVDAHVKAGWKVKGA